MLASKRTGKPSADDELVVPAPRQNLFAQLNVRIDPMIDARLRRFCSATQARQAHVVSDAIDTFLKTKGY